VLGTIAKPILTEASCIPGPSGRQLSRFRETFAYPHSCFGMAIMPVDQALMTLFDYCGVWPLTDGHHQVVVDIHFVDVTANRPLGVKYALILQDLDANRIVGYDNSHQ